MPYIIETRKFVGSEPYVVGHKMAEPPRAPFIETNTFSIIYDVCDSREQAKAYCEQLVNDEVVKTAALLLEDETEIIAH